MFTKTTYVYIYIYSYLYLFGYTGESAYVNLFLADWGILYGINCFDFIDLLSQMEEKKMCKRERDNQYELRRSGTRCTVNKLFLSQQQDKIDASNAN